MIMGTNTEKPYYVLGVISCKLGNANQSSAIYLTSKIVHHDRSDSI